MTPTFIIISREDSCSMESIARAGIRSWVVVISSKMTQGQADRMDAVWVSPCLDCLRAEVVVLDKKISQ